MKHISHVTKEMPAKAQLLGWLNREPGFKGANELGDLVFVITARLEALFGPLLPADAGKSGA